MIEEALYLALKSVLPDATIYPSLVPQGAPLPWVVYRETGHDDDESFYARTNKSSFEIDAAFKKGLDPEDYRLTKIMANDIAAALRDGFEHAGICVYDVNIGKRQDEVDTVDCLHWTRSTFEFTYDTPL